MILCRLLLNPRSREVRRDLANVYQLHRTVMSGFPTKLQDGERVLFRVDDLAGGNRALLVQSRVVRPEWAALPHDYLLTPDPFDPLPNPAIRVDNLTFHQGQVLRFRLRANPTVKKKAMGLSPDGKGQGRRVAISSEVGHLDWLRRKGQAGGFRPLDGVWVADLGRAIGSAQRTVHASLSADEPRTTRIELSVVQFDGLLEIIDSDQFAQAVSSGIGSGKGFGCGLLSLARA
jgi:CRISPR system Cascade subunit CasE